MVAHINVAYADKKWYPDNADNTHITHDLENLSEQQTFQNNDLLQ
jgi:hypothetical protein